MKRGWPRGLALCSLWLGCAPLGIDDTGSTLAQPTLGDQSSLPVEIGTGIDAFERLDDGDAVDIVEGPQGGHHVWTGVRVADANLDHALVRLGATFEDTGEEVGSVAIVASTFARVGSASERAGLTTYVTDPAAARGRRLVLRVVVQTDAGRVGGAERIVIAR